MQCGRFAARWRRIARESALALGAICVAVTFWHPALGQSAAVIHGASQYGDSHVVTRTLQRFEELVRQYYGKPIELVLHSAASRGLERQYFATMWQGSGIDYAIVAPVHMRETSAMAQLIGAPFLFRDAAHWNAALASGALKPFTDEIAAKAGVRIIGFAGGSSRNLLARGPVATSADLKGLTIRVLGAPLRATVFAALGMQPTSIPPSALRAALESGKVAVVEAGATGIEAAKLYEAAPYLVATMHAFVIRPICFSEQTFRTLPADLQEAIVKAGAEAAAFGRKIEQVEDAVRLDALQSEGQLKRMPLEDRARLKALADPAIETFAKQIDAEALLSAVDAAR